MKRSFIFVAIFLYPILSFSGGLDDAIVNANNPSYQQPFLNESILLPQFIDHEKVTYQRYTYDPFNDPLNATKEEVSLSIYQIRAPYNRIAINRFDKSHWIPALLEEAKKDPWSDITDDTFDDGVDEVEVLGIINSSPTCVYNAFKQFDLYSIYVKDDYFLYSYELNNNEQELLKLKPAESNEIYHYTIFNPSPFIGEYQSVVKYTVLSSFRTHDNKSNGTYFKIPQTVIAWDKVMLSDFSQLPGRGSYQSKANERQHREDSDAEMYANSGYMVFEPLILNGFPQGEYELCSTENNACSKLKNDKSETLLHGIFYLKPDVPMGDYPYIRQNIMNSILTSIVDGLRASISDAIKGVKIRTIDGVIKPLIIEGCK